MSVPEKPYTRKEAYLNAAATGDTSGIPETPHTREEMHLDAIAKNGGGGGGGGGSGVLVVNGDMQTNALDRTWKEIHDAAFAVIKADAGAFVVFHPVIMVGNFGNVFAVIAVVDSTSTQEFITDSEDGYPVLQQGG